MSKILYVLMHLLLLPCLITAQDDTVSGLEAGRFHKLCKLSFASGNFDEAIEHGKKAVELDGTNSAYHLWLGIAYSEKTKKGFFLKKLSNAKKSKKAFERGVELDPSSADAREGLLEYLVRAPGIAGGSFNKAKEQAAAISKIDSARGHLAFAYIYEREKDYPAAEQELKKAIEFAPERTEPYFRLGSFYWDQKDFEKAEAAYVKAVENDPDEPRAYYQLGWFYQIRNEHERAIEAFQKILEMNPDEANALFFLASSYLDLKEFEMADEVLAKILKINPDYTGVNFLRGKQALLSGKNLEQGIGYLEKYLQIDPQEMYYPSWSYTHLLAGIESYGSSWAAAHFIMGLIYEDLGNRKKAEKEYKKALKLDPKLVRAKEALDRLK